MVSLNDKKTHLFPDLVLKTTLITDSDTDLVTDWKNGQVINGFKT